MNCNYSDLIWEIGNFESQGFKFFMKILLFADLEKNTNNEIIYGEFIAIKEEEIEKFNSESDYIDYINILYISRPIEASDLKDFVETCYLYKKMQYMKIKEKENNEVIRTKIRRDYNAEQFNILHKSINPIAIIDDSINILLRNLNYTSECRYYESDPMDYNINKDSSTAYYQLDFAAQVTDLREYDELLGSEFNYYPTINDFIIHKFDKDFSTNSRLKNSLLFILPKEHIGRVKVDLVGKKLTAKLTNLTHKKLQLKMQAKRSDTLELQHLEFNFEEKNMEEGIELDFVPDRLDGYLLAYQDDYPEYKIQKIVKRFDITELSLTNEKKLREIIQEGEGLKTDFKLIYPHKGDNIKNLNDSKIIREICSFANADGGVIIFGVNDDTDIKGYDVKKQFKTQGYFEQHIQKLCNDEIEPPVTAKVYETEIDSKTLQIVQIFPNDDNWVRLKKSKFIIVRKGSTARKTYPGEIKKYPKTKNSSFF